MFLLLPVVVEVVVVVVVVVVASGLLLAFDNAFAPLHDDAPARDVQLEPNRFPNRGNRRREGTRQNGKGYTGKAGV